MFVRRNSTFHSTATELGVAARGLIEAGGEVPCMWLPSARLCLQPPSLLRGKDSSRDVNRNAVMGFRCNEFMGFGAWQGYVIS